MALYISIIIIHYFVENKFIISLTNIVKIHEIKIIKIVIVVSRFEYLKLYATC